MFMAPWEHITVIMKRGYSPYQWLWWWFHAVVFPSGSAASSGLEEEGDCLPVQDGGDGVGRARARAHTHHLTAQHRVSSDIHKGHPRLQQIHTNGNNVYSLTNKRLSKWTNKLICVLEAHICEIFLSCWYWAQSCSCRLMPLYTKRGSKKKQQLCNINFFN